ncbi:MAG: ATP-binding protein [Parachlamydiaceae bacterium]|nr:ATP-binding protein [Parachlamydiaceae bacterium]
MEAWEHFLTQQETELGVDTVHKWLRSLRIVRFDAGNLYLRANDSFHVLWFEEHIRKKVLSTLVNNNNRRIKVHLALDETLFTSKKSATKIVKLKEQEAVSPLKFSIHFDILDPLCTFENYVISKENPLPHRLLFQLTGYQPENKTYIPQQILPAAFNPIYICGPSGTGKTHLLMATAHALKKQGLSVAYVRAETFTEHVVTAIRAGEMSLFRHSYRNADVLIIDDVHLFGKKWATQEELFHTFNTLHLAGKQIIVSANCNPGELQFIEPRMVSRFEWGIALPLRLADDNERALLLQTKAEAIHYPLNGKVAEFLLEAFSSSPKALCRALEALILRTHLSNDPKQGTPTIAFAQQHLSDLIMEEQKNLLTTEKIVRHVSEYFGIRTEDILGKGQSREYVLPRQIAMYICRLKLKLPFAKIGELFGKDHSTVMSSVKLIQKGLDVHDDIVNSPLQIILKHMR